MEEVDKRTVKGKLKDASNPDIRLSNVAIQQSLDNLSGRPK